jgi:hypothetical protein
MKLITKTLLLALSMVIACSSARSLAAEGVAADCHVRPTGKPPSGGRWVYQTDRTNGQKCWFIQVASSRAQPKPQSEVVAEGEVSTAITEASASKCVAAPNGLTPINGQWRYRFDKVGRKCWHLVNSISKRKPAERSQARLTNKSNLGLRDPLKRLRSVADAQGSLAAASGGPAQGVPSSNRNSLVERIPDRVPTTTFEDRWVAPIQMSHTNGLSRAVLPMEQDATVARVDAEDPPISDATSVKSEAMARFLLATVASIGIAMSAVALASKPEKWVLGRASKSDPEQKTGLEQSLPEKDWSIADVLERLNKEDRSARSKNP